MTPQRDRRRVWRGLIVLMAPYRAALFYRIPSMAARTLRRVSSDTFGDGVAAFARVRDMGYDELEISVALWPKPGAERYVNYFDAGFAEADVIATGMIERRRGAWLQSNPGLFRCRKKRVGDVAAVSIEPNGYRDHGPVIL